MCRHSPAVRKVGKRKWELLEEFTCAGITVPKGFVTDGASVPRVFWWMFSPGGALFEAAIIHDYMYKKAIQTKLIADQTFKHIAIEYQVSSIRAQAAYLAVKIGGKGNYSNQ